MSSEYSDHYVAMITVSAGGGYLVDSGIGGARRVMQRLGRLSTVCSGACQQESDLEDKHIEHLLPVHLRSRLRGDTIRACYNN